MMAEVLLLRDDVGTAEEWLTQATVFEQSHDDRNFAAEVHRLSAVCRARRGLIDEARAELREAMAVARSQAASTFELRAALTLTELDRRGRETLRAVLARFLEPAPWPEVQAAHRILQ